VQPTRFASSSPELYIILSIGPSRLPAYGAYPLYRHFSSKESLYQAIVDRKMRAPELVAFLAPPAERRDDRAVFGGLAREIFRRIEEDPAFLRILFFTALENHALSEPIRTVAAGSSTTRMR
jgi:AcrR family transcriptional regulator